MPKAKIMIVDDDAGTRLVLSTRLRAHHYDVVMASDALQAITIVRKESPNLLILDIGLPGGDGFLVVQRLKAIPAFASIPIIIISAAVDPRLSESKALDVGAEAFLSKPVEPDELLATVKMIVGD
ncbi:MAG: response regulator [Nitrospiraceae bacterium]|jgi:two-component system KDP operon response regulator KdpE|nr:response regulator [Nitrospiraceae bacterium]